MHQDSATPAPRPLRQVFLITLGTALFYAVWAFAANATHGAAVAARAAAVQSLSSGFTTLTITGVIEAMLVTLPPSRWRAPLATFMPPSFTAMFHATVHHLAGTPEIVPTILPSVVLGYLFAGLYAVKLAAGRASSLRPARGKE